MYSPLLEEHGDCGDTDTLEHRLRLEKRGDSNKLKLDNRPVRTISEMREVLCGSALLEQRLSPDLGKLELNKLMILWKAAEIGKSATSIGFTVVVYKPTV